jgi:methyl-accepting chemotaxis protein
MVFLDKLKLSEKIVGMSSMLVGLTFVVLIGIVLLQKNVLKRDINEELNQLALNEASEIAKSVYRMCYVQQEAIQYKIDCDLNVAREILDDAGVVSVTGGRVSWMAVNQFTGEVKNVSLPRMMVGSRWLGQNRDINTNSLVVDDVKRLVGGTCTIFQRMNNAGDMLRVCTNVERLDSTRAIGTYIPYLNPDGSPNPVISAVLRGETYHGQAYVVNAWYITAYEPIWDNRKIEIIGLLYVGIKQEEVIKSLRKGIMDIVVGKTGYAYVLSGTGDRKGHYIISKNGKRDGENIWDVKDSEDNFFVRSIVEKGLKTKECSVDFIRYPWRNEGETESRMKIAAITYFEPWDWVIGAGAYEDDFIDAQVRMAGSLRHMIWWIIGTSAVVIIISILIGYFIVSRYINKPLKILQLEADSISRGDLSQGIDVHREDEIGELADSLNNMSNGLRSMIKDITDKANSLNTASIELASLSEELSGRATSMTEKSTSVASAAEEMSTTMSSVSAAGEQVNTSSSAIATATEEMSSTIVEIAQNSEKTRQITTDAVGIVSEALDRVNELGKAAKEINKVIEVIFEIAEKTELLALNATIEAARAGEAGKGFAVVANEVKELAKQTNEATDDIRIKIETMQRSTDNTVSEIERINKVINDVNNIVVSIASAVEEQATTTGNISDNILQAVVGIRDMTQNVSQAAETSKEIASDIASVSASSNELEASSAKLGTNASELSQIGGAMKDIIDRFKL